MVGKYIFALLIAFPFGLRADDQELLPQRSQIPASPIWVSKLDLGLYSVAWSPNSQLVAIGGRGTVRICRAPSFSIERTLETGQEEIWGLAWSPDGTLLACAGKDGTVQFWQEDVLQKKLFQGGWILDIGWNPDGTSIMAVDYTGLAKEWDVQGYLRASIQLDGDGLGVDWSPKGRLFAVTTGQGGSRLLLFDAQSGVLRWRRQDLPPNYVAPFGYGLDEVNGVRYSPRGSSIATAHQDGRILVHSAATGDAVFAAQMHHPGMGGARRVAWSSKGDWLVSCGEDGRVSCVPYPQGKQQVLLLTTDKAVWSVDWSPDNNWIAAVGEEGRAWIWSTSFIGSSPVGPKKPAPSKRPHTRLTPSPRPRQRGVLTRSFPLFSGILRGQRRATFSRGTGVSCEIASNHRPCSRIRSTNRLTASASGILNLTAFLPT
jgi:WD40 repeat protein